MTPGTTYHIYNHANGTENLFRENENYRYFLSLYKKHIQPIAKTCAYCLLPNHFHFLIEIKDMETLKEAFSKLETSEKMIEKKLSKQFSNFFSAYTQAFNIRYGRKGSLFIKNFKRKPIESVSQWQETFLYIHLNPVKHRFTSDAAQWCWSSWRAYLQEEKASLIDRKEALEYFDTYKNIRFCMETKKDSIIPFSSE